MHLWAISSCEYRRLDKKKMHIIVLYVKKDSQTYFSLMRNSVVNVGREEQRCQFDLLVNKQRDYFNFSFSLYDNGMTFPSMMGVLSSSHPTMSWHFMHLNQVIL
jgi:hypothetical protein